MTDDTITTPPRSGDGGAPAACTITACGPSGSYGKAIAIDGSDEFNTKTRECLDALQRTPTGAIMLKAIDNSGKKVIIKETSAGNSASPDDRSKAQRAPDGTPGAGTGSTVKYNPSRTQVGDGSEPWMTRPACVGLAHEMVHVYRSANGTNDFTPSGEDMAVGIPPYDTEAVTENKIRDEWLPKQPQRPHY